MVDNGKAGFARDNTHSIYEHLGPEMNLSQPMNAAANGSASTKMLNTSNHFEFMQTCSRRLHVGWSQLWCSRSSTLCFKPRKPRKVCGTCGQLTMFRPPAAGANTASCCSGSHGRSRCC